MPQLELLLLTEQSLRRGTMMNSCLLVLLVSVVCCNGAYPSTTSSVSAAFSRSWATRAFKNTPHGQIHYVYGGDFKATPTVVLFHSHPRSAGEFAYLLDSLHPSHSFVAFDYFGMGASDDCTSCNATLNEYVSIPAFGEYAKEVLSLLEVGRYASVGSLKGAAIATY